MLGIRTQVITHAWQALCKLNHLPMPVSKTFKKTSTFTKAWI